MIKLFQVIFKNARIRTKFNLLLMLVFLVGILGSGAALSSVLQQRAQSEIASKAELLMETMNAVRSYTNSEIFPLLEPKLNNTQVFIPQAIPTFSVRRVFENFSKKKDYKNFYYKDATLNPTNLHDKADEFEAKLVERFIKEPQTQEISDYRTLPQGKVFYVARPFIVKDQRCLRCHSTPEKAPKSLLATYGKEHGFGWQLNQIIATQIVSVPAQDVFDSAHRAFVLIMGVLIGIFGLVIFLTNFLLRKAVIQRIIKIARTAQEVSLGEVSANFEENSKDEIGILAAAFNRMKAGLEIALKLLDQKSNEQ